MWIQHLSSYLGCFHFAIILICRNVNFFFPGGEQFWGCHLRAREASKTIAGRKRSNSSSYTSLVRDRMLSVGSDSLENSHPLKVSQVLLWSIDLLYHSLSFSIYFCMLKKIFNLKTEIWERGWRSHDADDMPDSLQLSPRPLSSLLVHQPVSTRPEPLISNWEHSLPICPRSMDHSSSYTYKDVNGGAMLVPQAAADEGSRTGMRGSGISNIINSSSGGADDNAPR